LTQAVCIGTLPELAASERPLADASRRFLGPAGASLIAVGGLISTAGTAGASFLAASRLLFAMAERDQLPRILAATHPRFHTPHTAILVSAAVMLALTLSGTFIYLVTVTTVTRLLTYTATCAALPVLRRKGEKLPAVFQLRAGRTLSAGALVLCAWLLMSSGLREVRDVAIAASIGLLIYFVRQQRLSALKTEGKFGP